MLISFLLSIGVAHAATLTLKSEALVGTLAPQVSNIGPGAFDSYLVLNLPFPPQVELKKQIESEYKVKLKQRDEAHITVITPVEFRQILRPAGLSMNEIDSIAREQNIQNSQVNSICVGRGDLTVGQNQESTYYVVVSSPALLDIRKRIQKRFEDLGGKKGEFKADWYFPHITIGFTTRDLHESDGVIKDKKSCIAELKIQ